MNENPMLAIQDLCVSFRMYEKGLRQVTVQAVHHLHLSVHTGEILAVVGSSGSGKSLLAHAVLGILPVNAEVSGTMAFLGQPLTKERQAACRGREMTLVPQSVAYLDPLEKVGRQVRGIYGTEEEQKAVFKEFELPPETADMYPFQLSGGMARRVLVGTAVMSRAKLVIADEPTPGLSLDMARHTMRRFRQMAEEGRGVLLITHDLDLAVAFADRIAVFYAGTVLETVPASAFQQGGAGLHHPYSRALWAALPQNGFEVIPWKEEQKEAAQ